MRYIININTQKNTEEEITKSFENAILQARTKLNKNAHIILIHLLLHSINTKDFDFCLKNKDFLELLSMHNINKAAFYKAKNELLKKEYFKKIFIEEDNAFLASTLLVNLNLESEPNNEK